MEKRNSQQGRAIVESGQADPLALTPPQETTWLSTLRTRCCRVFSKRAPLLQGGAQIRLSVHKKHEAIGAYRH